MRKIKKDSKNHNSKNIDHTDLWLAPFERNKANTYKSRAGLTDKEWLRMTFNDLEWPKMTKIDLKWLKNLMTKMT